MSEVSLQQQIDFVRSDIALASPQFAELPVMRAILASLESLRHSPDTASLVKPADPELLLPFLDEMSKHANWCRKNVSGFPNCTCPAEGAAHEAATIREYIARRLSPDTAAPPPGRLKYLRIVDGRAVYGCAWAVVTLEHALHARCSSYADALAIKTQDDPSSRLDNEVHTTDTASLVKALEAAHAHIDSMPHGDNCFLSRHYDGDPGDRCNCGKSPLLTHLDEVLAAASMTPIDTKGEAK